MSRQVSHDVHPHFSSPEDAWYTRTTGVILLKILYQNEDELMDCLITLMPQPKEWMQTNPKSTKLIICFVTRQIRYTDMQLNCGEQAKPSVIEGLCFVHLNLNIYTQPLIIIIVTVASENLNGLKKIKKKAIQHKKGSHAAASLHRNSFTIVSISAHRLKLCSMFITTCL